VISNECREEQLTLARSRRVGDNAPYLDAFRSGGGFAHGQLGPHEQTHGLRAANPAMRMLVEEFVQLGMVLDKFRLLQFHGIGGEVLFDRRMGLQEVAKSLACVMVIAVASSRLRKPSTNSRGWALMLAAILGGP